MSTENKKLTPQEELFVEYYLQTLNAMESAKRAGYTESTARAISSMWSNGKHKPYIKQEIQKRLKVRMKKLEVTSEKVLSNLAKIAFYDNRELYDDKGDLIPVHLLPDDVCANRVRTSDQTAALKILAQYLGLLTEKVEHSGSIEVSQLSPEERKLRIEILKSKAISKKNSEEKKESS